MLLDSIHSPADVRALPEGQLPQLCQELREFLVKSVSKTGGHLASNLGAVELTVAIHRVFDTERDRLVFDVGHQCYVHKMLTGRREQFATLRQLDGLSGFPKPHESVHDAFIAGHASNSVSVALGMARARTLGGEDYRVLALIGDGALTGGLAYEGLNNAGASGEPLIVILNDNGMSIDPNVGVVAVPDSRLTWLSDFYHPKKTTPAVIEFVDIAGLVKGASQGAGLGNKFLANIRECDAIVHVVRCFDDENIMHVVADTSPTCPWTPWGTSPPSIWSLSWPTWRW